MSADWTGLALLARPVGVGTARLPGIKIHDTRMIRLMEVPLEMSLQPAGRRAAEIHQAILSAYDLSPSGYGLNSLRYDLRRMRAHGLIERDGHRYACRLTARGVRVAVLFVLFHQRLCGPLAHSLFHHAPDFTVVSSDPLEAASHKAGNSIRRSFSYWKLHEFLKLLLSDTEPARNQQAFVFNASNEKCAFSINDRDYRRSLRRKYQTQSGRRPRSLLSPLARKIINYLHARIKPRAEAGGRAWRRAVARGRWPRHW